MILMYRCYADGSAVIKVDDRMLINFESATVFRVRGVSYSWNTSYSPTSYSISGGLERTVNFVGVAIACADRCGNSVRLVLMDSVEPVVRELTPPQAAQVLRAVQAAINFVVSNWGTATAWQRAKLCK